MTRPLIRLFTALALAGFLSVPFAATGAPTLDALQSLVDAGRYDAALAQSKTYLQAHPGNRAALFLRAVALAGQGDNKAAIDAFKALAKAYPQRPEPANNLAALYARSGQYAKARKWLERALATQPIYAVAHRNLGDIYTALATMAYSQVLNTDGDPGEKGMQLTLVNQLYYPREAGVPVGGTPKDSQNPTPDDAQSEDREMEIIEAPPPIPEPARPPDAVRPEPDAPKPPPLPQQDPATRHNRSIIQTMRAWATAWSERDFDAYIAFYAEAFAPGNGMSRSEWRELRHTRVVGKDSIHIEIIYPKVALLSDERARVTFVQIYESPTYSDKVTKRLLMQRTPSGWRILRETSSPLN